MKTEFKGVNMRLMEEDDKLIGIEFSQDDNIIQFEIVAFNNMIEAYIQAKKYLDNIKNINNG
jgi:hypothetical protein